MATTKRKTIEKKSCFVIMPINKCSKNYPDINFNHIYKNLVKPTLEKYDFKIGYNKVVQYKCELAESPRPGNILNYILPNLANSDLVLADITDSNPNVFYELGIRLCFQEYGTIIICQINEDGTIPSIPFDLKDMNIAFYSPLLPKEDKAIFMKKVRGFIKYYEEEPNPQDSPIYLHDIGKIKSTEKALIEQRDVNRMLSEKLEKLSIPPDINLLKDWIFTLEDLCQEKKFDLPPNRPSYLLEPI